MRMVFISQPMRDRDPYDIAHEQMEAFKAYQEKYPDILMTLINPYHAPDPQMELSHIIGNHSVKLLGESISNMSYADVVLFLPKWDEYPGCRVEHKVCTYYNIPIEYAR